MSRLSHRLASFSQRHPRVAPIAWVLTIHYFIAQFVTAVACRTEYNWTVDLVSDLGVTVCRSGYEDAVCSPLYPFFNVSVIAVGVAMALGALLLYFQLRSDRASLVGFSCLVAAGVGTTLLGVFPSDTVELLHHVGTGLAFLGSTTGIVLLGFALRAEPFPVRCFTVASAAVAIAGLILLLLSSVFDSDYQGAAERLASYPQILWFIVFGLYSRCARSRAIGFSTGDTRVLAPTE